MYTLYASCIYTCTVLHHILYTYYIDIHTYIHTYIHTCEIAYLTVSRTRQSQSVHTSTALGSIQPLARWRSSRKNTHLCEGDAFFVILWWPDLFSSWVILSRMICCSCEGVRWWVMGRCVRGVRDWIRCCGERTAWWLKEEKCRTSNDL